MADVAELPESQQVTFGDPNTAERHYLIHIPKTETNPDEVARSAMLTVAPLYFDLHGTGLVLLPRESVSVEPERNSQYLWHGTVRYSSRAREVAISRWSFSTDGGGEHVTQSLQTLAAYGFEGSFPPDMGKALNVTDSGVEGLDLETPAFAFAETHTYPAVAITEGFCAVVFGLTKKVNNAAWRWFAQGEVLLRNVSGQSIDKDNWDITYEFLARPNRANFYVGAIEVALKRGHEYLWARYEKEINLNRNVTVKVPTAVYVEKVYEEGNFALLGI